MFSFLPFLICGLTSSAMGQFQPSNETSPAPSTGIPSQVVSPPSTTGSLPPPMLQMVPGQQPGNITLHANRAALTEVLKLIARNHQLNLVAGPGVGGEITLSLENAHLHEVLDAIAGVSGHRWHRNGNLLHITGMSGEQRLGAAIQGRILRVFPLNFVAAADVQPIAQGLLSPIGQAFVTSSDPMDKTKTSELLVIEDVPEAVQRVEQYILQIDQPPRQVLIEVHVLQVLLTNGMRHGVNLAPMTRLGNGSVTFRSLGFANEDATMGMKMTIDGSDISGLVELIQTQANTRTLASPKLLVANRQESNIQIGKRLSYLTTTTTQTAAVQSVQFLDTGIVLIVTPIISDDDQVLLQVSPKVSGGQLNAQTNLPEEESTELSTTVLLPNGGGVIMGGLLKEEDIENIAEVPGLCRIPYLGNLFRRKEIAHVNTEIIIALVAHIVPQVEQIRQHERFELQQILPPHAAVELLRPTFDNGWQTFDENCPVPTNFSPTNSIAPTNNGVPVILERPTPQLTPEPVPAPKRLEAATQTFEPGTHEPVNVASRRATSGSRRLPGIR